MHCPHRSTDQGPSPWGSGCAPCPPLLQACALRASPRRKGDAGAVDPSLRRQTAPGSPEEPRTGASTSQAPKAPRFCLSPHHDFWQPCFLAAPEVKQLVTRLASMHRHGPEVPLRTSSLNSRFRLPPVWLSLLTKREWESPRTQVCLFRSASSLSRELRGSVCFLCCLRSQIAPGGARQSGEAADSRARLSVSLQAWTRGSRAGGQTGS